MAKKTQSADTKQMHFRVSQQDLQHASGVVQNLISRSATSMPLLSNVLIEAEGGQIAFTGTDIESMVRVRVPGEVLAAGRVTVPADKFNDLVKLLPPGCSVEIEEDEGRVHIVCEANDYKLMTLPASDFPEWVLEPFTTKFQLAQRQLQALVDATQFALPNPKEPRKILHGVLAEIVDMSLRFTTTDGKKLARMSVGVNDIEGQSDFRLVIPGKFLADARKVLGDEGVALVELHERQARITVGQAEFCSHTITGRYPDCNAVIPREFPFVVGLNRDVFLTASRRAGVVSDERNKSIILKLADNWCHFSSMAADVGMFAGKVALDYAGTPIEFALNYEFLIQTISGFKSADLKMKVKSPTSPVLFACEKEPEHLCVLMPVKLVDVRPVSSMDDEEDEGGE